MWLEHEIVINLQTELYSGKFYNFPFVVVVVVVVVVGELELGGGRCL